MGTPGRVQGDSLAHRNFRDIFRDIFHDIFPDIFLDNIDGPGKIAPVAMTGLKTPQRHRMLCTVNYAQAAVNQGGIGLRGDFDEHLRRYIPNPEATDRSHQGGLLSSTDRITDRKVCC